MNTEDKNNGYEEDYRTCEHQGYLPEFDEEEAKKLGDAWSVRAKYPRTKCLKCGTVLYHSRAHYVYGDW